MRLVLARLPPQDAIACGRSAGLAGAEARVREVLDARAND